MQNLRAFKISQKYDVNGNRKTTIADLRNNKKVIIKNTYEDDVEVLAKELFQSKNINIVGKFEVKKDLYMLSDNFNIMIK